MGVRGLFQYVVRHKDRGSTQSVDLVWEASQAGRSGVTLLVDLSDFAVWLLPQIDRLAKEYCPDGTFAVYGGEFAYHDEVISAIVFGLRAANVFLEFFVDAPRGCGLVDAATGGWNDEAKHRYGADLAIAKAVRQWARGERSDISNSKDTEAYCLPELWYEQMRSSLSRAGCYVWHLKPEEQAPLLSLGRNSDWGHVWGVVSDNVDWTVVRGVRLIPLQCFDLKWELVAKAMSSSGWPQITSLSVAYTSADLLAEILRLGHPPREEEIREANEKGKGKGRGPVGYGQWPYKWWNEQVLVEIALICGTEATTPFIQKHKLYQLLHIETGADPMDGILRWVRNQLYTNKLRWRDFQLESLSPIIADLVKNDKEFELALEASRAVYRQNTSGVRAVHSELMRLRSQDGELKEKSTVVLPTDGYRQELPEAASLLLRSAANSKRVWLQVHFEDVIRNGAPLAHTLLADLRRLMFLLLRQDAAAIHEHGIGAEQRSGLQCSRIGFESVPTDFPTLEGIQNWTFQERWALFRRIVEHNLLQAQAIDWNIQPAEGEVAPPKVSVEIPVWEAYQAARNCPACTVSSFLHACLEYFASLNHRPEQPLIREHEFDSMAALVALSCDASLPGSPLEEAPEWAQQRFGEVKVQLCQLVSGNFHQICEVHIPLRASILAAWFQGTVASLIDCARLLWLDVSENGEAPSVWLPEPRELFSGSLFAGLYCGGAFDAWELKTPQSESAYQWNSVFKQMSSLRGEIVGSNWFRSWRQRFFSGLPRGTMAWPSKEQLYIENQKNVEGQEELPIDEHRDKILNHIDKYRVTCIQGETGCGKSTRVPVFVMEEYLEKKKKGLINKEHDDKFMVLCTQPRRIACISLANRVATCLKEKVGNTIGYKISGDSNVRPGRTKLVYVTTGYLLQVLVNNPEQIKNYSHVILDEVHERDVDSDLLSLVIKLQMTGYHFKLVVMSATLQGDLFSKYFSEKKIKTIFVGVKRFPVEVLYLENLLDRYGGRSGWDERAIPDGARGLQAPFSHQASKTIRDCERQFGTGYGDNAALEEDAYNRPGATKGEFDSSDESSSDDSSSSESGADKAKPAKPKKEAKPSWNNRRKEVMPQIQRGLDILVYELITRVANPGEGILIFLPGIGEITELHETLMSLEDPEREGQMSWDPSLPRPDVKFKVFVLHSLIPKDEQEGAVFDAPPADVCHVILSSNIAESSLTIPKIRIVIDFGLRRQLVYDKRRHMSCLVTRWVSQASAKQRCGRTGRVFEGVNIRLFTKNYHESFMEEFDPPEMQTAPLEKLYVNVKHLSAKLPEYQITPTEKRKRSPKELLQLVAQPPDAGNVETAIKVLDDLGALTGPREDASLTALGYLMMSVPLDVQLCRLVIFGAVLNLPCDGVVLAAGLSVQDPFTLPSHLIIKDPREYAEALKRSYDSRAYFDHGHLSEPLMLRAVFITWISEFRQIQVDKGGRRGGRQRQSIRQQFLGAAQAMASKFAIVPKRVVNFANSVLDTSQRMRKFMPSGSQAIKRLDGMLALLQAGDTYHASSEEAEEKLPKLSDLFSEDVFMLKTLLVVSFTPQFMCGGTKIRNEEPHVEQEPWAKKSKKKAPKPPKKEPKGKLDLLVDEIVQHGLDPTKTVHCQLELPRGRGGRWLARLHDDVHLTLSMITCGKPFNLVMSGDNKCLICFDTSDTAPGPYAALADKTPLCAKLEKEDDLVEDLPSAAHYIDLYGAGRFKFQVPLLSAEKLEREKAAKEAAKNEREGATKVRAAAKAAVMAAKGKGKDKNGSAITILQATPKAAPAAPAAKEEDSKKEEEVAVAAPILRLEQALAGAGSEDTDAAKTEEKDTGAAKAEEQEVVEDKALAGAGTEDVDTAKTEEKEVGEVKAPIESGTDDKDAENDEERDVAEVKAEPGASPEPVPSENVPAPSESVPAAPEDGAAAPLEEIPAPSDGVPAPPEENVAAETVEVEAEAEALVEVEPEEEEVAEYVDDAADLGPMISIYKPVSPYEMNWEVVDPHPDPGDVTSKKGKAKKKKVTKGKCNWRNQLGFLGSCSIPAANFAPGSKPAPWPNDVYAVYTNTQGGESKDLSWVDGVTCLPAEKDNVVSFVLLMTFLRYNQELSFDVDLQDGRIHAIRGVGGLEINVPEDQVLLIEDIEKINAVRSEVSKGFYMGAKKKVSAEDTDKGLDFTGFQSRRDDEIVPQISECDASEKLKELIQLLRQAGTRNDTISMEDWNKRLLLRKSTMATIDMHRSSQMFSRGAESSDENFVLFEPLTDLMQAKQDAERHEQEEEMRRWQGEEEKRRQKEEAGRRKQQDKKQKQTEDKARKTEEQRLAKEAKGGSKGGAKGKAKAKSRAAQQEQADQWYDPASWDEPAPQPKAKSKAKAKAGKGKGQDSEAGKGEKPEKQKKGKKGGAQDSPQPGGGFAPPEVPAPWTAVPDPNTGRFYYWNQLTNETSWTPPTASGSSPTAVDSTQSMAVQQAQAAFMQQQHAFYMAQQMAAYQQSGGFPGGSNPFQ